MILEQERNFAQKKDPKTSSTDVEEPRFYTNMKTAIRDPKGLRGHLHELAPKSQEKLEKIKAERGEGNTTQGTTSETSSGGINDQLRGLWGGLGVDDGSIEENLSDTSRARHDINIPKIS